MRLRQDALRRAISRMPLWSQARNLLGQIRGFEMTEALRQEFLRAFQPAIAAGTIGIRLGVVWSPSRPFQVGLSHAQQKRMCMARLRAERAGLDTSGYPPRLGKRI